MKKGKIMFDELILANTIELRGRNIKNEEIQFRAILTIDPEINYTRVHIKSIPTNETSRECYFKHLLYYLKTKVGGVIQIDCAGQITEYKFPPQRHLLRLQHKESNKYKNGLIGLGIFGLATYAVIKYSPIYQEDIKTLIHRFCG